MAKTVQDVFDEMSDVKKDAAALLFGAIAENDDAVGGDTPVRGEQTLAEVFENMTDVERALVGFIAGGIEPSAQHDAMTADDEFMEDFLEHFGVKGMRWGVRKDRQVGPGKIPLSKSARNTEAGRREARLKVKQGVATLDEAHVASLKSTGHRVANGFLGDKTFWKRTGVTAGLTAVGLYGSLLVPGLFPDSFLKDLGNFGMVASMGNGVVLLPSKIDYEKAALDLGSIAVMTASAAAVATAGAVTTGANAVGNVARAIRGNARVSKSHEKLGSALARHQAAGNDKTAGILNRNGSVKIRHDDLSADDAFMGDFLEHFGIKGMRWGIRRKVKSDGTVDESDSGTPSGKSMSDETADAQKSADFERASKAYAKAEEKGLQSLSNDEIRAITARVDAEKKFRALSEPQKSKLEQEIARMTLEKQYRDLKSELSQKKRSTGRKIVDAFFQSAVETASSAAKKQGQDLIKEMLGQTGTKKVAKSAGKAARSSGQFKVNPAKVTITRPPSGVGVP